MLNHLLVYRPSQLALKFTEYVYELYVETEALSAYCFGSLYFFLQTEVY
jgi:hypothetical protein